MLIYELFALITFSCWHYGKVYHEKQKGNISFEQSLFKVIMILFMCYLLFSYTILFFCAIAIKLSYDVFMMIMSPTPILLHTKNKENLFDAMLAMACCVLCLIG